MLVSCQISIINTKAVGDLKHVGEAKVVRQSEADQVLVVAAGVTLHEAMKAADTLAAAGVNIRVMDPFTIKPLDWTAVQTHSAQCSGRVVTVEDHVSNNRSFSCA